MKNIGINSSMEVSIYTKAVISPTAIITLTRKLIYKYIGETVKHKI